MKTFQEAVTSRRSIYKLGRNIPVLEEPQPLDKVPTGTRVKIFREI